METLYIGYPQSYRFPNPISGARYHNYYNHPLAYTEKLEDFYLPSLFDHISHIVVGTIIYGLIFYFFKRFRLKIE